MKVAGSSDPVERCLTSYYCYYLHHIALIVCLCVCLSVCPVRRDCRRMAVRHLATALVQ